MQNKPEKKWFLILNRSPRGPFTEREINELLGQGLIRHNDLALLQEEGSTGSWKFLWQYAEFDSRKNEKVPPPPEILEKRKAQTEEQIQEELEQQIPLDLKSISINDLIIRAKPRKRESDNSLAVSHSPFGGPSEAKKRQSQNSVLIKVIPLFLFALALAGMILTQKTKEAKTPPPDLKSKAPRGIATQPGTSIPKARKSEPPPARSLSEQTNMSSPKERDRGEIREEEILRIREAERLKEIEERARRERERELLEKDEQEGELDNNDESNKKDDRSQDEEELSEDDENQSRSRKSRNRKGRGERSSEEEEEPSSWLED